MGIDQLLWNPIFGTMFFGYLGLAEGQDFNGIKSRIEKDLWASVKGSWTVWPIAHAINFRFIPNEQRLLYINSVQVRFGWEGLGTPYGVRRTPQEPLWTIL